jgi:hypothetical protein
MFEFLLISGIVAVVASAASVLITKAIRNQQKPKEDDVGITVPTADEGAVIPVVFGTALITSPNVVWYGDLQKLAPGSFQPGGSSSASNSNWWFGLGMHMVFCTGPVDEVEEILVGEKTAAWDGGGAITSSTVIQITDPDLFGGDKGEGGLLIAAAVLFGDAAQAKNAYLQAEMYNGVNIPAFRGVLGIVVYGNISGYPTAITAATPYIKPWWIRARRLPGQSWYTNYDINGGANPAHILYEVITNSDWGMGYPDTQIDSTSFESAADQLYAEDFGLSFLLKDSQTAETFIKRILTIIQGILYLDPTSGLFILKLIRDDYTAGTLDVYDESNIIELTSFERPSPAETVNEVVLKYWKQGENKESILTFQDLASVQSQQAVVSQEVSYLEIDSEDTARFVGQRELQQYTTPLAYLQIKTFRNAWNLAPGDVIKVSWADLGISELICRVLSVDAGSLVDGTIVVSLVEDIFALPDSSYVEGQPNDWENPILAPQAALDTLLFELPYWDIVQRFSMGDLAAVDAASGFVQAIGLRNTQASPQFELWGCPTASSPDTGYSRRGVAPWVPYAEVYGTVTPTQTTISLQNLNAEAYGSLVVGQYLLVDEEIVRLVSINTSTPEMVVGRGCLDTVAAAHTTDDPVYFVEGFDVYDSAEYADGETRYAKFLTVGMASTLVIGSASAESLTLSGRQNRPYPPGLLKFNAVSYPTAVTGELAVTWAGRNRLTQTTRPIIDETASSITPEAGTTYEIAFRDENGDLAHTESGITGESKTWTTEREDSPLLTGLVEWGDFQKVLDPLTSYIQDPCVILRGATYEMYMTVYISTTPYIYRSTSADRVTWSTPAVVLSPTGTGFEQSGVFAPSVIYNTDTSYYEMLYAAIDTSNVNTIGYCRSTDGVTWTNRQQVIANNLLGTYDVSGVLFPSLLWRDGADYEYQAWYVGEDAYGDWRLLRCRAVSNATSLGDFELVMDLGHEGTLDLYSLAHPTVWEEDHEVLHMLFAGDSQILSAVSNDLGRVWQSTQTEIAPDTLGTYDAGVDGPTFWRETDDTYRVWYAGTRSSPSTHQILYAYGDLLGNLSEYTPPEDWEVFAPLTADLYYYTAAGAALASAVNVAVTLESARFVAGYLDLLDYEPPYDAFSMLLTVKCDDVSPTIQALIGFYEASGAGGADLLTVWRDGGDWNVGVKSQAKQDCGAATYGWETLLVVYTAAGATSTITIWQSGAVVARGTANFADSVDKWGGRSITLGSDWVVGSSTRQYLFTGRMRDFRLYPREVTPAEVWTGLDRRLNRSVRTTLKAVRGGVDSYQSHDYTVARTDTSPTAPDSYRPPSDYLVYLPLLRHGAILGSSSRSVVSGATNVTYEGDSTLFDAGYAYAGLFGPSGSSFSIVFSVYPNDAGGSVQAFATKQDASYYDQFGVGRSDDDFLVVVYGVAPQVLTSVLTLEEWHTFLVTVEPISGGTATRVTVYQDGVSEGYLDFASTIPSWTGGEWLLGADTDPGPNIDSQYDGYMRDWRLYDRLLTAAEVWGT